MKINIPYNIKKILPILGIAAAPLFTSCEKDEPLHDVELIFHAQDYTQISIENLTRLANDPSVRNIYMCVRPNEDYTHYTTKHIHNARDFHTTRLAISPKIRGRGEFHFAPGAATKEDSLFFVHNGWTVNQTPLVKQR